MPKLSEVESGCLKLISGGQDIVLEPTDGKRTFVQTKNLFPYYFDPGFKNYSTDVPGPATKETKVAVHEMAKDGDFRKIFGSFEVELDQLCLSQDQIIQFVKKQTKWLYPDEVYGTYFLFKVGDNFFVADVRRHAGRLRANLYHFSYNEVWNARYRRRVVVPQLTTS